jgi:hypothetical protein
LNNEIKLKEYKLKAELKAKGKLYSDPYGEVWLSDQALELNLKKSKGLLASRDLHPTIMENAGLMNITEELEFKDKIFRMMESYTDMIYSDANELHTKDV